MESRNGMNNIIKTIRPQSLMGKILYVIFAVTFLAHLSFAIDKYNIYSKDNRGKSYKTFYLVSSDIVYVYGSMLRYIFGDSSRVVYRIDQIQSYLFEKYSYDLIQSDPEYIIFRYKYIMRHNVDNNGGSNLSKDDLLNVMVNTSSVINMLHDPIASKPYSESMRIKTIMSMSVEYYEQFHKYIKVGNKNGIPYYKNATAINSLDNVLKTLEPTLVMLYAKNNSATEIRSDPKRFTSGFAVALDLRGLLLNKIFADALRGHIKVDRNNVDFHKYFIIRSEFVRLGKMYLKDKDNIKLFKIVLEDDPLNKALAYVGVTSFGNDTDDFVPGGKWAEKDPLVKSMYQLIH